jgi:voltage-gated potassium channel
MEDTNSISKQLKKPIIPGIILIIVIIVGTIGYGIIWEETDSTIYDEIYMTFITITTIGFNEIYPLDTTGRIFTILIGISGIGSLFYMLTVVMENLVLMQISNYRSKKKRMKQINSLENHVILVGLGRVGKLAASQMKKRNQDFVLIEHTDKEDEVLNFDSEILYVLGNATEDDILNKARISDAKGMIVATANPSTTVFVVFECKSFKS